MAKLLSGFRDPTRRPRSIILSLVTVFALVAAMTLMLGATSTRWFCAEVCHKVQDDTITAYASSPHSKVSCMACHEPVNADPVTFIVKKAQTVPELYQAMTNTFRLPLNEGSALSLNPEDMSSGQCTQCHLDLRGVVTRNGIVMNHKVHADKGIWCTVCHNRVAHDEQGRPLTLTSPDGTPNAKHRVFTDMTACFRCHDLEGKKDAPGTCSVCHTPGFTLKPPSHAASDWPRKGHVAAYAADQKAVVHESAVADELVNEGVDGKLVRPVSLCSTCHIQSTFCIGCHGMQVPHMADFESRTHPVVARDQFAKCVMCHGDPVKTGYCESCHHGTRIGWTFDRKVPWIRQHGAAANKVGAGACYVICHHRDSCYNCHPKGKKFSNP